MKKTLTWQVFFSSFILHTSSFSNPACHPGPPCSNTLPMRNGVSHRFVIEVETEGSAEAVNLMPEIARHAKSLAGNGVLHLFVVGSTAALTTIEYEPGLVKADLPSLMQKLVPDDAHYHHEATWHDDNGHSHLRASLVGPSLTIPFENGKLLTGEYQQAVLIDFDTRPRRRKIIATIL
jgi:secondary thiamine-phosphate synthase enzyme